jgi:hypothetical protein
MSGYRLDTNIQTSTLYLDSINCIGRSPNFKYSLATPVTCPTGVRTLLSVFSASLPNVINNVTLSNNTLSFSQLTHLGSIVVSYMITFPVGIYSAWTFRDYINSQTVYPYNQVQCVYDEKTFRFNFVSVNNFRIDNTLTTRTTCEHLIGIEKNDNNQYVLPVYATNNPTYSLVMPSTVNFNPTPYIFLKISNIPLSNINSRGIINDTLIRIPVNCNYGEMIPTYRIK